VDSVPVEVEVEVEVEVVSVDVVRCGAVRCGAVRGPRGSIISMDFTAAITHEDPWYVARCLDIEVASQGKSTEEALANLKEALELYFYFEDEVLPDDLEPLIIATVRRTA
jgi:predicted RNase H-like HicB family nuclease